MTKFIKQGLLLVGALLALSFVPAQPSTPDSAHLSESSQLAAGLKFKAEAETLALFRQEALIVHLARKYQKPVASISRVVRAAYAEGRAVGLAPLMLLAMVEKESSFRADIVNHYGAVGLMQVVPRFHLERLSRGNPVKQLQAPETNIQVGAQILADYVRSSKGDLSKALSRYSGRAHQYEEKVLAFKAELEAVYNSVA